MEAQASTAHWLTLRGNTSLYADSECSLSEIDPQEETWEDWENEEDYEESKCLFCSQVFSLPQDTFGHCKTEHGFDFLAIKQSLHLDFYKCIRMLNYIRSQVNENPALSATKDYAFTGKEAFWEDDHFLQPVLEEDALLHAFEELELDDKEAPQSLDVETVDVAALKPTTALEAQLILLLKQSQDKSKALEKQFNDYKAMIRRTFFEDQGEDERNARNMADPNVLLATASGTVPWNLL